MAVTDERSELPTGACYIPDPLHDDSGLPELERSYRLAVRLCQPIDTGSGIIRVCGF